MQDRHPKPNWFIGIPVPPTNWFQTLPPPPQGIRLFHPDDLHATIAFLGPIEQCRAIDAWNALNWPIAPVTVQLRNVTPMGNPNRYSALAVRLASPNNAINNPIDNAIAQCRDQVCHAAKIPVERRPPMAHTTIARPSRNATHEERTAGLDWASSINLHQHLVQLSTIALFTWAHDRRSRQFQIVAQSVFPQHAR